MISERPPSIGQKRLATSVAAIIFVAFAAFIPFRDQHWHEISGFIPVVDTILFFTDLMTAVLLYGQFSVSKARMLLALANGYFFTSLIIVPHLLTFPGAMSATGLLGANLQSTVWLYILWHFGMPLSVILYSHYKHSLRPIQAPARSVAMSVCLIFAIVCGLTILVTAYGSSLPTIMIDSTRANSSWAHAGGPTLLVTSLSAIALLWIRRKSLLDTWLLVVLWAWFIEVCLLGMTSARFTVIWYGGRVIGLIASSIMLIVLLYETTMAYARLAVSASAHERERSDRRLSLDVAVGSIAHELHQPLTAIVANCDAGIQLLGSSQPDIRETQIALADIQTECYRASEIIRSIEGIFAESAPALTEIDVDQLIGETLILLRTEVLLHSINVQLVSPPGLPPVRGNKGQLLQVFVNLIANAIDAMRDVTLRPRVLTVRSQTSEPALVSINVEDSGAGIQPEAVEHIFDPFYTTKSTGTGLGLAICRSIVEAHSGRIELLPRRENYGSVFEVLLPVHRRS